MPTAAGNRLRSLYLCYLSLEDPLVHTQVLAYLAGLAAVGHRVHLLTFEVSPLTRARRRELRESLAGKGIYWHGLRYHKRPSLPATAYDTVAGALVASTLVVRHRLDALHARNHVPAAMALIARRVLWWRQPALIFDIRGLMAEEYEDAGRWRRGSMPFRLTKAVERDAIGQAAGVVVLTERVREQLFGEQVPDNVQVIPCCADVEALAQGAAKRDELREQLGLGSGPVMIYVGKFGGWYMADEMAQYFATARKLLPGLRFLILTQGDRREIEGQLQRADVDSDFIITSASPDQVAHYLAAADFGISFIRPAPSKVSSSPTKVGEYLGAGLAVLSTAGVGDLDALLGPDVGALVTDHGVAQYEAATERISELLARRDTRERCRALALKELSLSEVGIPRYVELYEKVADRAGRRRSSGFAP